MNERQKKLKNKEMKRNQNELLFCTKEQHLHAKKYNKQDIIRGFQCIKVKF